MKQKDLYYFTPAAGLLGKMQRNKKREIIKILILPYYQRYAEEAAKTLVGFDNLYDPYGPAYIDEKDDTAGLLKDIEILCKKYKHVPSFEQELLKIRDLIFESKTHSGSIIMVSPDPIFSFGSCSDKWYL